MTQKTRVLLRAERMRRFDMPLMTPISMRSLSANEAQACTLIAQRAQHMPLRIFECDWLVAIVPVEPWPQALADAWFLHFEWSGGRFVLSLPNDALAEFLAAAQLYDPAQALPDALAELLLEAVFAEVFDALRPLGRGVPQLLQAQRSDAQPGFAGSHALALHIKSVGSSNVLALHLQADAMGLLVVAGAVAKRAPMRHGLREDMPLPLRVMIGRSDLPQRDVAALAVGDVLLLQDCRLDPLQQLWLAATPSHGVLVKLAVSQHPHPDAVSPDLANAEHAVHAPLRLLVVQAWSSLMTDASEITAAPMSADGPLTSLEDLPVQLSFDVGELSMTLAQLRQLAPGQVLDFARPLGAVVNVRANGVLLAQGDLVSIDGRLGVSLQQVFLDTAQPGDQA